MLALYYNNMIYILLYNQGLTMSVKNFKVTFSVLSGIFFVFCLFISYFFSTLLAVCIYISFPAAVLATYYLLDKFYTEENDCPYSS